MILDVIKVQVVEAEEKETVYKVTLRGFDHNLVKMTTTIEGISKRDIERYTPMMVGERRNVEFKLLDRTLDEFGIPALDTDDLEAIQKSRAERKLKEEVDEFHEKADAILEKRRKAAAEQAGGE